MKNKRFGIKALTLAVAGMAIPAVVYFLGVKAPVAPRPFLSGLVDGIILVGLTVWLLAAALLVYRRRAGTGGQSAVWPGQLWLSVGMTGLMLGIWLSRHLPEDPWASALVILVFLSSIICNIRYLVIYRRAKHVSPD
jgi:hypothetical protein